MVAVMKATAICQTWTQTKCNTALLQILHHAIFKSQEAEYLFMVKCVENQNRKICAAEMFLPVNDILQT